MDAIEDRVYARPQPKAAGEATGPSRKMEQAKVEAQKTWGASPTGWTSAPGMTPGTKEFFEAAQRFRDTEEQPWLEEVVRFSEMRGRRVLEIGFGPGYDTLKFLENGADYSGIDLTPENVERTRRHLGYYGYSPDVRQGDAEALPFVDGTFDVVYSNGVLHHVPDMSKAFKEAFRVLKPGGRFIILIYNRNSVFYILSVLLPHFLAGGFLKETIAARRSRIESTTADAAPTVNVFGKRELGRLVEAAGFRVHSIPVRKCTWQDFPVSGRLGALFRLLPRNFYNAVGRVAGWYLIVRAAKP